MKLTDITGTYAGSKHNHKLFESIMEKHTMKVKMDREVSRERRIL